MPLVDADDVRSIITTALTDTQIDSWIEIASNIITRYSAQCTRASEATLTLMEKLLTAHLIVSIVDRSKAVSSRSFGDSSETYMAMSGEGIKATPYGQQLIMLDPCGILVDFDKRRARSWLL